MLTQLLRSVRVGGGPTKQEQVSVIAGFNVDRVEESLARSSIPGVDARVVYNPFFRSSDNLGVSPNVGGNHGRAAGHRFQ